MPNYDVVHVIHRSIVFAFALLGMSCSTDDAPRAVCIRGRTNLCPCPASKAKGVQTCLPDGSGYGVCEGCENTTVEGGFAEVTEALGLNYRQGAPFDPPTNCITQRGRRHLRRRHRESRPSAFRHDERRGMDRHRQRRGPRSLRQYRRQRSVLPLLERRQRSLRRSSPREGRRDGRRHREGGDEHLRR